MRRFYKKSFPRTPRSKYNRETNQGHVCSLSKLTSSLRSLTFLFTITFGTILTSTVPDYFIRTILLANKTIVSNSLQVRKIDVMYHIIFINQASCCLIEISKLSFIDTKDDNCTFTRMQIVFSTYG